MDYIKIIQKDKNSVIVPATNRAFYAHRLGVIIESATKAEIDAYEGKGTSAEKQNKGNSAEKQNKGTSAEKELAAKIEKIEAELKAEREARKIEKKSLEDANAEIEALKSEKDALKAVQTTDKK